MLNNEPTAPSSMTQVPLLTAADVQDNLLVANNDLERLAGLLTDATETLMGHFYGASAQLNQLMELAESLPALDRTPIQQALQHMGGAVTAVQSCRIVPRCFVGWWHAPTAALTVGHGDCNVE